MRLRHFAFLNWASAVLAAPVIDQSAFDSKCGISITVEDHLLRADWKTSDGVPCEMVIGLAGDKALIQSLSIKQQTIAREVQPVFRVATGPRKREAVNARYTFFDNVFKKGAAVTWEESMLKPESVRVSSAGVHATIEINGMTAGLFHGSLQLHLYAESPLVHLQAVMTLEKAEMAYSYEVVMQSVFAKIAWCDLNDEIQSAAPAGVMEPVRVRYRTIMGQGNVGTLAVFPPPHALLYPKDEADNFGFVQAAERGIGICQPVQGLRLSPLFDAPPGQYQRMGVFLLLSEGDASATLERVKRYTHGDTLKEIEGHTTLITHEHASLTVHDRTTQPSEPSFVKACKKVNVKIIQLAEFHGDGLTSKENVPDYGTVYHLSDAASAHQMLKKNNGLAWTAHSRIKSSRTCPDEYKDTPWYQSEQWLGATWKSMPGDLSQPRLGVRCLDLLDDMNLWGQRKFIVGEFDCFHIDESSEFYGNINASYLRLARKPTADDWSPVLDCLRKGDFFVRACPLKDANSHNCGMDGEWNAIIPAM